jgi:hypothetical protein
MPPVAPPSVTRTWLRRLPILLILAAALLGAVALRDELSFETLARHREELLAFRDAHYLWAVLAFLAAYVAIVALSLPGGTVATLTGGFLFGLFPGVLYNVLGAGTGAVLSFWPRDPALAKPLPRMDSAGGKAAKRLAGIACARTNGRSCS